MVAIMDSKLISGYSNNLHSIGLEYEREQEKNPPLGLSVQRRLFESLVNGRISRTKTTGIMSYVAEGFRIPSERHDSGMHNNRDFFYT